MYFHLNIKFQIEYVFVIFQKNSIVWLSDFETCYCRYSHVCTVHGNADVSGTFPLGCIDARAVRITSAFWEHEKPSAPLRKPRSFLLATQLNAQFHDLSKQKTFRWSTKEIVYVTISHFKPESLIMTCPNWAVMLGGRFFPLCQSSRKLL